MGLDRTGGADVAMLTIGHTHVFSTSKLRIIAFTKNIFHIGRVSLPQALQCQRIIVTYEVIIGIQKLIDLSGKELSEPSWDVLCDILIEIYKNIKHYGERYFIS